MAIKMKRKVESDDDGDGPEGTAAKKQLLDAVPAFSTGKYDPRSSRLN